MGIWNWAKEAIAREWRKPLRGRKRRPGEPMFNYQVTTGISQNNKEDGNTMPKVNVSSKAPAIPAKRKRKAKKLTPQQVAEIKAKAAKDAEGKPAEPEAKPAQPAKGKPSEPTLVASQKSAPSMRLERQPVMNMRRQPIMRTRPPRITAPRPRIGR